MKRRILLVDDEIAVLLTLKAVLEISGFDVDTAASAGEGKSKLRANQYHMVITDMRMESDVAGSEVVQAARQAPYHPAVALLTAFPVDEEDWNGVGPDKILVKATHTRLLLGAIEKLFASHSAKLSKLAAQTKGTVRSLAASAGDHASPKPNTLKKGATASPETPTKGATARTSARGKKGSDRERGTAAGKARKGAKP